VQMPEIDGPHTLTVLRALDPEVGVVFMSGNTGQYTADELLRRGARHVLQKPFSSVVDLARILWQVAQRADRPAIVPTSPVNLRPERHEKQ
jgi:CheY-like chemotaxis protein